LLDSIDSAARFVWDNIRLMGLKDVLDIIIVAFLIYKLITFFARTGSGRVVRGVVLLLLLMWVGSLLKLTVVNYLMGQAFQMGLLVVIIVFQPELRHMLERVGSSDISLVFSGSGNKSSEKETESAIAAVAAASAVFSRTYTGALLVFERKIRLDDYIKSGTQIEANVKSELIENIFYPKTPLHDGAAIIRNGRLAAAACMLPLSANPNIDRNLGTRHRAAIGLSELSDAVVIVVSEETGTISLAVEGMLKSRLSAEMLQQLLRKHLLPENVKAQNVIDKIKTVGRRERI
jgi:diadenylate cyclase